MWDKGKKRGLCLVIGGDVCGGVYYSMVEPVGCGSCCSFLPYPPPEPTWTDYTCYFHLG